jgi:hypothetical protein
MRTPRYSYDIIKRGDESCAFFKHEVCPFEILIHYLIFELNSVAAQVTIHLHMSCRTGKNYLGTTGEWTS